MRSWEAMIDAAAALPFFVDVMLPFVEVFIPSPNPNPNPNFSPILSLAPALALTLPPCAGDVSPLPWLRSRGTYP